MAKKLSSKEIVDKIFAAGERVKINGTHTHEKTGGVYTAKGFLLNVQTGKIDLRYSPVSPTNGTFFDFGRNLDQFLDGRFIPYNRLKHRHALRQGKT